MNKEDAKMRLQSKPLAAALWLKALDRPEDAMGHLPDPAFTVSQNWPDYGVEKTEEMQKELQTAPKIKEPIDIEFIKSPQREDPIAPIIEELIEVQIEETMEIRKEMPEDIPEKTELESQKEMKHSKKIARIAKKAKPEEEPRPEKKLKKAKKSESGAEDFYSWLKTMSADTGVSETKVSKPKKETKTAKKQKPEKEKDQAEKSLKLGEEIVSETLARLLARQGYKEDSIAMYEKLRKKYPQKESTFAAAIEKLKS